MLNIGKGIVPQLVNQYNEIIEQNLCQTINLNEFRDNQSNRFDETIVLSDQNIDKYINNSDNRQQTYPEITGKYVLSHLIREESYRYVHQINDRVLVKTSQTVSPLKNNQINKNSNQNKNKEFDSCDDKKPEVIERQSIKELVPIKLNSVLEYLIRRRKHSFVSKTIVSKEICGICGQIIKFSEKYIQCLDCIAVSHMMCASELPVPCIKYTNPNLRPSKLISNYVYPAFRPSIPSLVIHCIREIEQRCHETTPNSLYIMNSESLKQVKDLCNTLIKTRNAFHLLKNFNVNIICGVIKKFLYDFNESLIGRDLWKQFSYNMKKKSEEELQTMLKPLIKELSATNRDTLSFLVLHLRHLADNQKYICLDNFIEIFCPIVCGDTEVTRKLRLMTILFQLNRDFWTNFLM